MINDDFDADARREAEREMARVIAHWRAEGISEMEIERVVAALVVAFERAEPLNLH